MKQHLFTPLSLLVLAVFFISTPLFAQQETVTVSVSNGEQIRCVTDSTVEVTVVPNPDKQLVEMTLIWDEDNGIFETILPGESFTRTHVYDLNDFLGSCSYDCIGNNGFCIPITVFARYEGGESEDENNGLILTWKLPPRPNFAAQAPCRDTEITIENETCPSNDLGMTYRWDFGNGQTSEETSPSVTFDQEGSYQVQLEAENLCGPQTFVQTFNVIAPAQAVATADSNITSMKGDTFVICTPGIGGTRLVGSASPNATRYSWSRNGDRRVTFLEGTNRDTARVSFAEEGIYNLTLEVDNGCNQPSTQDLVIEVITSQSLRLNPTPDACLSLSYQPEPFLEAATYLIDGQVVPNSNFPIELTAREAPYLVEARLDNPCNTPPRRDTFRVVSPEAVRIQQPVADTSVCTSSGPLALAASQPGGQWLLDGSPVGDTLNPADFGAGSYRLRYEIGEGNCQTSDERDLEILAGTTVDIGADETTCIDTDTLQLTASETGGIWSGPGVVDSVAGLFVPSVAGPGLQEITYLFERSGDGCRSQDSKSITVVDLPQVGLPDSAGICDAPNPIALAPLLNPDLLPGEGTLTWEGPGVSNGTIDTRSLAGQAAATVYLTYEIEPGCRRRDSTVLSIAELVAASATPDTTLCSNQEQFLLEGMPAGGIWRNAAGTEINPNLVLTDLGTGTQTFEYTINEGTTCESRAQTTLDIIAAGGVQAGDDLYICETELQLELPERNGTWTGPELVGARAVNVSALDTGTYVYQLTDPSLPPACNTDELALVVSPVPVLAFEVDSTICLDEPVAFTNTSSGADNFEWLFGDGNQSNAVSPQHTYSAPGGFTVELFASSTNPLTGDGLCLASAERTVNVTEPPELVSFVPSTRESCAPAIVDFENQSIGEDLIFSWDFGLDSGSVEVSPSGIEFPPGFMDTTYLVRLTVANGCGGEEVVESIRVLADPQARFASEVRDQYCSGEEVVLGHRSLADSLFWELGNGTTFEGFEPPVQRYFTDGERSDTLLLRLIATNQCDMDTAEQALVIVPTDARAAISVPTDRPCQGDTILLESLARPLDARVEWVLPDGSTQEGLQVPYAFAEAGPQRIISRVYSCGFDSTEVMVDVQPLPTASLDFLPQACPGQPVRIQLLTSGIADSVLVEGIPFTNTDVLTYRFDSAGVFPVTGIARNEVGCRVRIDESIEIIDGPVAAILAVDSICVGESVELVSQSASASSCSWLLSDGTRLTGCSVAHAFEAAGAQSARLLVRNGIGCVDSIEQTLFVRTSPIADFEVDILNDCTPANIRLTNRSQFENGITWTLPDGSTPADASLVVTLENDGTFPIRLQASTDGICFDERSREVTVFANPNLTLDQQEGCTQEEGYTLVITSEPAASIVVDGPTYQGDGTLHRFLQPGDYLISAETPNGCQLDTVASILPVNELRASIDASTLFLQLGEEAQLNLNLNQSEVAINWSPPEYFDDPSSVSPTVLPQRSGLLISEVTDARGCTVRDTVFVSVEVDRDTGLFIPNAFTPDLNGTNDFFMVRSSNVGLSRVASMRVYDPAGTLVFEMTDGQPNDPTYGWDGTFRTQPARAGTYAYLIELEYVDGARILRKGDLTLIR